MAAIACLASAAALGADGYPTHLIKVINPWPPGGPGDLLVRPMLEKLSQRLGQTAIMENRPGANGTIGAATVAAAAPDGYTLLLAHVGPTVISQAMKQKPSYDSEKDFAPITQAVSGPLVLVVRPDLPIHSVAELVSYAKAHPGKLSYGSVGIGSTAHLAGEMLKVGTGIDMLHVPFKGSTPALTEMLGGRIDLGFVNIAAGIAMIHDGRLRAVAVTTKTRSSLLPDLPPVSDTVPDFEVNSWYAIMAPAGTPPAVIDLLSREMRAIYTETDVATLLRTNGLEPLGSSPAELAQRIHDDLRYWDKVAKETGVTGEE
ncbi:MAG: tripartite tricarboxylate transporter substrate binding protein [Pseudomonadota bacterium]